MKCSTMNNVLEYDSTMMVKNVQGLMYYMLPRVFDLKDILLLGSPFGGIYNIHSD